MKIELIDLSEDNMKQCFELKVASDQMQYIASNKDSWKAAKENEKVARPFAIYCDGEMVGFTMFAFDEDYEDPDDRYWLWRLMVDESLQGKGYGTAALQTIIQYFRDHGANNIRLSTKESNKKHCPFEQAEKEVEDLHQRTREGIQTARLAGKQIGGVPGKKLTTKKSIAAKKEIRKYSRDFEGSLTDKDVIKLVGLARGTYYKYKREIRGEA